jgi:hypothetical protein
VQDRMLASEETTCSHTQAIQVCERRDQGPVSLPSL